MRIAIDVGHGWVKAVAEDGGRVCFPALIAPMPATVDLGEFASMDAVVIEGTRYVVGESARQHATPLWSREKAADPDTLRLHLVAAAQLGAVGPVKLVTGLPLAWYGPQRRALRETLTGFGGAVTLPGRAPQRLWFDRVLVLPQGVAAAGPVLATDAYEPGTYVVVDVGYRTTDHLLVEKTETGKLVFAPDAAGSIEIGVYSVFHSVADALAQAYHLPFTAAEVEAASFVTVRGQKIDVTQRIRATKEAVGRQVAQKLAAALDAHLEKVLGVVAVGGGADLLAAVLPGCIVSPDPQWANAAGYLAALEAG
ncbi:MAG: ParM/StbA family protein [Firmicutes bacterium]|nr:ParM/StbA family protein [Bacillota bacterium]